MAVKKAVAKKTSIVEKTNGFEIPAYLKQPKVFIPLVILILLGVLFVFKGLFVAAIVNGRPITRLELIRELEKKDGKQVLSNLVVQTLILEEAQKKGITVDQKEIDESIQQISDDLKKQRQNLDQALAMQGMSRNDFIAQIRIQKTVEKIFAKDTKVTDKDVNDYIEKNKSTTPTDMKLEDVKKGVMQQLEQQKLSALVQPWIADLQKKAKILYFVNY